MSSEAAASSARGIVLAAEDGVNLEGGLLADGGRPPLANVLVIHGMADHSGRYRPFAGFLASKGIHAYGFDLRGHGRSAGDGEDAGRKAGFLALNGGWDALVRDVGLWVDFIQKDSPGIPLFLLGHCLGSFLARAYAASHGDRLAGLVLSGTGSSPKFAGSVLRLFAKIEDEINGRKEPGTLLFRFLVRMYAHSVKGRRTRFDWLSRDEKIVDAFIADPLCGRPLPAGFLYECMKGAAALRKPAFLKKTPRCLPVYLFSGSSDPVGNFSKGVTEVYREYQRAGLAHTTVKIYSGGRHEMLHETNREEVYHDVLAWMQSRLAAAQSV